MGGILPLSLTTDDSVPYGGPQSTDGKISFHGTFRINPEQPKEIIKIYAPTACIIRILTIASENFKIESAVYNKQTFDVPIAYSKNKSQYGSFIFELAEQTEPYFLVLSHILNEAEGCLTYDLKVVIIPKNTVGEIIECKLNARESLLPGLFLDFSMSNSYGSDSFAIMDK